ncbi:secreted protein [Rhodopirellula maiorica SM1]|uniref:Secreted protein n=1 Tax=Rhodopirellula maiorica SM1 TaxID=1265738 RepID=M5RGZ3_9BACT|nr:secreted protein [Rhodopirellula maiorica]EMI18416.1 secreted protein [Rhodopirellula maiorica SM1]
MIGIFRICIAAALAGSTGFTSELTASEPQALPVSASVKFLSNARTDSMTSDGEVMMAAAAPPVVTLPGERLPQYQTRYQRREFLSNQENDQGEIRFLLCPPTMTPAAEDPHPLATPILVRAKIMIDDAPFTATRREKVASILSSIVSPAKPEIPVEANDEPSGPPDDSETTNESESETEDPAAEPPVAVSAPYQLTTESGEWLRRYAEATGEPVAADEAAWLMNHWTDGPTLLLLQPYFQSFRANERPVFQILDRDRDGRVSAAEQNEAVSALQKCDANRNDIVEALEIAAAARSLGDDVDGSAYQRPLLLLLADLLQISRDDASLFITIAAFDVDQNGRIDDSEISTLENRSPDIDLLVEYVTANASKSKLSIVATSADLQATVAASSTSDGVDVNVGGTAIQFSALQNSQSDQISLGAVVDGYPLLPMLDPNSDGRFTIRELRELEQRLTQFDQDGDGALSLQETQSPIRVCLGLGPTVHGELAGLRRVKQADSAPSIAPPDWFVRMDRNGDNDLTRDEFPGLDEQFSDLDADADGLISAVEALQFKTP